VFDSCHSGTILDLPFTLESGLWTNQNTNYKKLGVVSGSAISISGCKQYQMASETSQGGSFSSILYKLLSDGRTRSFKGLITDIN